MEKLLPSPLQKTLTKRRRSKEKQKPLKVVYITNPIKFKASASEFKALVQELTGKHAEYGLHSVSGCDGGGGGREDEAAVKVGEEEEGGASEVTAKMKSVNGEGEHNGNGYGPDTVFGSGYDDGVYSPLVDLQGMAGWNLLDVLQSVDAVNLNLGNVDYQSVLKMDI